MIATGLYQRHRPKSRRDANDLEWVVVLRGGFIVEHKTFNEREHAEAFAAEHGYDPEPVEPEPDRYGLTEDMQIMDHVTGEQLSLSEILELLNEEES